MCSLTNRRSFRSLHIDANSTNEQFSLAYCKKWPKPEKSLVRFVGRIIFVTLQKRCELALLVIFDKDVTVNWRAYSRAYNFLDNYLNGLITLVFDSTQNLTPSA